MITQTNLWFMQIALEQAELAYKENEVPVGALIVTKDGQILSKAFNLKEKTFNPCSHAELIVIQEASKKISNWRLIDCSIYVTLEPCTMCLSAIMQARIKNLYFGAYDAKGGALSLGYNFSNDQRLNHKFNIYGGINHYQCSRLLSNFFQERRNSYKLK